MIERACRTCSRAASADVFHAEAAWPVGAHDPSGIWREGAAPSCARCAVGDRRRRRTRCRHCKALLCSRCFRAGSCRGRGTFFKHEK